ncbi:MAG TPA: GNAT family N-acetyltransferase, partial [Methylobacter sp.]
MKKTDDAIRFKPAKRLECFVISRDGVYAAGQTGAGAAIATKDDVYAESQSGTGPAVGSEALIKEAQALRFRVFAKEMGAKLKTESEGLDYDEVDSYCDHLIVYDNLNKKIVGYTRLLNQDQAERLGRFYSQSEFSLDQVLTLPGRF